MVLEFAGHGRHLVPKLFESSPTMRISGCGGCYLARDLLSRGTNYSTTPVLQSAQPSRHVAHANKHLLYHTFMLNCAVSARFCRVLVLFITPRSAGLPTPPPWNGGSPILAGFRAACLNAAFSPAVFKSGELPGRDGSNAGQTEPYPESSVRAEMDTPQSDQVIESALIIS